MDFVVYAYVIDIQSSFHVTSINNRYRLNLSRKPTLYRHQSINYIEPNRHTIEFRMFFLRLTFISHKCIPNGIFHVVLLSLSVFVRRVCICVCFGFCHGHSIRAVPGSWIFDFLFRVQILNSFCLTQFLRFSKSYSADFNL